jgi:hypothetical protein
LIQAYQNPKADASGAYQFAVASPARERMRDITSDRFALVKTSAISIQPRMDTDEHEVFGLFYTRTTLLSQTW